MSLVVFSLVALAGTARSERPLAHDAYIWQRVWTPAVDEAVAQSSDLVRDWRVLAAQSNDAGRLLPTNVDLATLKASGRPAVLVVRIDGQLPSLDKKALLADIDSVLGNWRRSGIQIAGLEIDHDCATERLLGYAEFLYVLRSHLGPGIRLSLTMLPTWLNSPDLDAVLAPADEVVLQVHAILNPRSGLFDPKTAMRWVDEFARRSSKPFRVSLPTYGVRVSWGADGHLTAVEGETPLLAGGASADELMASPLDVATFLVSLKRDPPAHLVGVAWFRLPVETDRRAWSFATWRAVVRGETPEDRVSVRVEKGDVPGLAYLVLDNAGNLDGNLPTLVELPVGCEAADGINGYALVHDRSTLTLERRQAGMLPGHARLAIGWMRCASMQETVHAAF
ncbi:MAG TPA: DUF3142 domain-containing protein [Alphaproteobacteria bacterium]|nr:DUF3142 domain-containing protein [Alphaproteobacteria bacterium]